MSNLLPIAVKTTPESSSSLSLKFKKIFLNNQQKNFNNEKKFSKLQQELGISNQENQTDCNCKQIQYRSPLVFQIIYTLFMPIVCVLGAIGAAICILIFTRRQMRSSVSIYLAGLSVFDFLLLLMSLIIYPSMNICMQKVK